MNVLKDDEMDGGVTIQGGRKVQMVLDSLGRFKEMRPLERGAAARAGEPSPDMENAMEKTLARMEQAAARTEAAAARAEKATGKKKPAEDDQGGQGGQGAGFVSPS